MEPERWARVRVLVEMALAVPVEERATFLHAQTNDVELIAEVEEHLAYERRASSMFSVTQWNERGNLERGADDPDLAGQLLGSYRLLEELGRGGMGTVYLAERADGVYEQRVALKVLQENIFNAALAERFRQERQILARLQHPGIARLLDGGVMQDGRPYLVLEYVDGVAIDRYCERKRLEIAERLRLFLCVADAVQAAHQQLVLHLDLKPANILVTAAGEPKLLDFGIAKVLNPHPAQPSPAQTEPAMRRLTVRYASPELVRGEALTTASDVYSLGVILYELLAEHSPYGDQERPAHQMMTAVCDTVPARPSVWVKKLKGDLDNIVLRALQKRPRDRYASVDQFSEDIRRYLEGRPVAARGEAPFYVAAKFVRRNRLVVGGAVLLFCTLAGGLIEVNLARARSERRFNQVRQLAHSVMFDYADAIDRLPGATPVRARLVKDALTYLDNLSKEADTPQLQREIVDAYVRVSNVQGNEYENNLGDPKAAMTSAHKAVEAAEKLLREDQKPAALSSAAGAFSAYGSLLYSTGDLKAADAAYQRALGLYQRVATASPEDLDNKMALVTCLRHMGDLYGGYGFKNLGKTMEGLAFYEQAKVLVLAVAAQFPTNVDVTKESYKTLLSLAPAEAAIGKHDEAAKDLAEALTQIQKVSVAEPADTNVKVELAVGESRLAQMLLDDRKFVSALPHAARSSELLQKLLDADPSNAIYRRGQSIVETQWAAALRGTGHVDDAVTHNERALQLAQALSKDAPGSAQYRSDVGANERKLSEGLLVAGKAEGALHHGEQAEGILCQASSTDSNGLAACGRVLVVVGNAYRALHEPKAAIAVLQKALQIASARTQADAANLIFRSDCARAQAALAGALADSGDTQGAVAMYENALKTWDVLRQAKSISAEDSNRSDAAAQALAHLQSRR